MYLNNDVYQYIKRFNDLSNMMTNNTIYDLQLHYVYMQNFMMLNSICVFAIKNLQNMQKCVV